MAQAHDWPDAVVVAYSPRSASIATGLKLSRIQAAIRDGSLRAVRVGVKTRITRTALEAWLDGHPSAARVVNESKTGGPHEQV
jgi:excisionase family DNA binding protein